MITFVLHVPVKFANPQRLGGFLVKAHTAKWAVFRWTILNLRR